VILLEGRGKVTLSGGKSVTLKAGQLVFVQPGGKTLSPVLDINLEKLVAGSLLVNGFSHPLSSLPLIQAAITAQNIQLASGNAVDTGVSAGNYLGAPSFANGLNSVDPGDYQNASHPPLSPGQFANLSSAQPKAVVVNGTPGGRGVTPLGF
jgi:hypothetical protein